ncbi:1-phosphatidylinositol 3-phosphate 5-kinase FAB1 [Trichinella pseudospiralis]
MLFSVGLFLFVSLVSSAYECPKPNGTAKQLQYYECSTNKVHALKIVSLKLCHNTGPTVNSIIADVKVEFYGSLFWKSCTWINIPTFGLLSNIRYCYGCPLLPGMMQLAMTVDFSKYTPILHFVSSGLVYAVEIVVRNGAMPENEIACLRVESLITT